jgi:hypothetical protein
MVPKNIMFIEEAPFNFCCCFIPYKYEKSCAFLVPKTMSTLVRVRKIHYFVKCKD